MNKVQPPFYSECDQGSEESIAQPLNESTIVDETALLNELGDQRICFYNCKCICGKECFCGKTYVKGKEPRDKKKCCSKSNVCSCLRRLNKPCIIIGLILCSIGILFCFFFIEQIVKNFVENQLILKEGTSRFNDWKSGEPVILYSVRIFNITNGRAFMKGARPLLREAGPYVYEVRELKEEIFFNDNDTLTFSPYPVFKFMPQLSSGSEEDVITTLNVPLVNAGVEVEDSVVMESILKIASRVHNFKSLKRITVGQLLWGHKSGVLDWARKFKDVSYPYERFGLMAGKNSTIQKSYTVFTGASDISQIQEVNLYGGSPFLGAWGQTICDQVQGSMIGSFHPKILPTETLNVFTGQLCRSLPLVFETNLTNSGLEAFRFVPPPDTFSYSRENPSNQCYCKHGVCPPQGVIDVRSCYFGAAIAFSFPHFYQGDPTLRHVVRGLRPDPELHGTQFDIYPALGVPLRVKLRMQMNVVIDGNQALQRDRHFDVVFPVFWFEAGIDSLPGEMVGMLKMAQDLPSLVKTTSVTICATLTILFLLLLLASTFAGWCGITPESSRTQTPDHLPDTHWPANHSHPILNSSGYTAGSLASLGPDDSYRSVLPPYRKTLYQTDELDGFPPSAFGTLQSEDRPPAYTTKGSSSSLLSVEIHKSASIHTLDAPPTPTDIVIDDYVVKKELPEPTEEYFQEEAPQITPFTSPSSNGDFVVFPLAENALNESSTNNQIVASPEKDAVNNPLATSSPSDSPVAVTSIITPSAPAILTEEDLTPRDTSRPPPLESDL